MHEDQCEDILEEYEDRGPVIPIQDWFGVDFTTQHAVTVDGDKFKIDDWFNSMGEKTSDPLDAVVCILVAGGYSYVIDIRVLCLPPDKVYH